ncbi:MAG: hypothetical protein QXK06_03330, partial [Candidatus Diapherotrites archaeon]
EKGRNPIHSEKERLEMVQALKPVDRAVLGLKGNKLKIIEREQPSIVVLGHDHKIQEKALEAYLARQGFYCKIVRLPAFKRKKFKSSLARKKICAKKDDLGLEKIKF